MNKKTKLMTALVLALAILLLSSTAAFAEANATSTQLSEWVVKGWSRIYKEGAFDSTKELTRGEYVALINSIADLKDKGEVTFADIKADSLYYNEVAKALKAGYIKGRGKGIFDGETAITKVEAYVMVANVLKLGKDGEPQAMLQFKDYAEVPAWAVFAVEGLAQQGYINDKNKIKPLEKFTGQEAVDFLEKAFAAPKTAEKKEDSGKGGGNNPLNYLGAYIASVENNQSANLSKLEEVISLDKDAVIKLAFDRGIVRDFWENNQQQIVLKDSEEREVAAEVFRIEGADGEKEFIFIKPTAELLSGKTYSIIIGKDLKANNGNALGNEVMVSFTVQ